jgi:polysaccharide chain length determinant protein (PEP-CTERM system associated)
MRDTLQALLNEAKGAYRFRWLAITVALLVSLVGWGVLAVLPSKFEATARVFVDTQTALSPVIQGIAIQEDIGSHLNLAQQSLVGEARLSSIINATSFKQAARSAEERAALVDTLRENIRVEVQYSGRPEEARGIVYTIFYRDSERARSLQVVEMLLNAFVTETLGGKTENAATAQRFLTAEIAETETRLREAEKRLADFKSQNIGTMPGVEGDYFTRLQSELDAVQKARGQLSLALARRDALLRQRSAESPFTPGGSAAAGVARSLADSPTSVAEAEKRLAALSLRYTDRHPDVITAREELDALRARRAEEIGALQRGDREVALDSGAITNPIYQSIQLQLNDVDVQTAEYRRQIAQHEGKIAELRSLVSSVPRVEADFARLNRDYEVTRAQYTALVERLGKAELGQDAETDGGRRFEVLNTPSASFSPVTPRRLPLSIAVLVVALLSGALMAVVLNHARPVFLDTGTIQRVTGLLVLGEVCTTSLDKHRAAMRGSLVRLVAALAVLGLAFVANLWLQNSLAT